MTCDISKPKLNSYFTVKEGTVSSELRVSKLITKTGSYYMYLRPYVVFLHPI